MIATPDHVHDMTRPVMYTVGFGLESSPGLVLERATFAVRILAEQYDLLRVNPGTSARITDPDGTVLLGWHMAHPSLEMPLWCGSDQMFGLLCEYRPWAEVAFFQMQRDCDLSDLNGS